MGRYYSCYLIDLSSQNKQIISSSSSSNDNNDDDDQIDNTVILGREHVRIVILTPHTHTHTHTVSSSSGSSSSSTSSSISYTSSVVACVHNSTQLTPF